PDAHARTVDGSSAGVAAGVGATLGEPAVRGVTDTVPPSLVPTPDALVQPAAVRLPRSSRSSGTTIGPPAAPSRPALAIVHPPPALPYRRPAARRPAGSRRCAAAASAGRRAPQPEHRSYTGRNRPAGRAPERSERSERDRRHHRKEARAWNSQPTAPPPDATPPGWAGGSAARAAPGGSS